MSSATSPGTAVVGVGVTLAFIFLAGMAAGYRTGVNDTRDEYIQKCVQQNSDMPHNKVTAYCQELLKFE